jgi:hypothetical protein
VVLRNPAAVTAAVIAGRGLTDDRLGIERFGIGRHSRGRKNEDAAARLPIQSWLLARTS